MSGLEPVWQEIAYGLIEPELAKVVGWGFGDFIFGTEAGVVSDMTKIRLAGFCDDLDPLDALIRAIDRQQIASIIPRITPRVASSVRSLNR